MTARTPPCHDRLRQVLAYIDRHLETRLSVAQLSERASLSKYHFHRQFAGYFGIGVYRYIQLCRLQRAAYRLAFRHQSVIEIALESGYQGPAAFARAFKRQVGQTPLEFRQRPQWAAWSAIYRPLQQLRRVHMNPTPRGDQVTIVHFPETHLAVLEHHGAPQQLGDTIRRFIAWRKQHQLSPKVSATFNILYNDPEQVAAAQYRLDLGVATPYHPTADDNGMVSKTLPGGRCARLRHSGADTTLRDSIRYLYTEWLPHSGEGLRDFPIFLQRIHFFPDVAESAAVTDIYLPLDG